MSEMKTQRFKGLFSSARFDWRTPQAVYEQLNKEFHFTFDPCPIAPNFDGLNIRWRKRNFVNPPYGRILLKWIKKGFEESRKNKLVVMLVPSRTDTRWFHDYILPYAKEIRFVKGRLRFSEYKNSAPFPSMIVVFKPESKNSVDNDLIMCYNSGMKKEEVAYWAGLFDGEGCISIRLNRPTKTSRHKSSLYSLVTKVTMYDEQLVRKMRQEFKLGHITLNQREKTLRARQRPAWSWTCMSKEAAKVIKILRPYFQSKAKEADIALEFMRLPPARSGRKRVPSKLTKQREYYYQKLRKAKGRLVIFNPRR